jgi:hypothetical protein
MTEPYQDPDPVSSSRTKKQARRDSNGESKKRFRNPFARPKGETKTTTSSFLAANAPTPFSTPFTAGEDDITLVNQEASHDPDAEFHHSAERWEFKLKDRKASAPASDVGVHARATSLDDRNAFAELMEKKRGMTPEQVAEFLRARDKVDGEKIMNGRKGDGYQMLAGPFMGTM